MTDETTLLPCPFCGGEAEVYEMQYGADGQYSVFGVFCVDDSKAELIGLSKYQHGHFIDNFPTEAEAIAAWNTRATHGTLTAEQVEKAIHDCSTYASYDGCTYYASGIRLQAIADELNARAERTCECVAEYAKSPIDGKTIVLHRCSACHELMRPHMAYCPNCGAKVRNE